MRENHAILSACATLVKACALMNILGQFILTYIPEPSTQSPGATPVGCLGGLGFPIANSQSGAGAPDTWHSTTFWRQRKMYVCKASGFPNRPEPCRRQQIRCRIIIVCGHYYVRMRAYE